MKDPVGSFEIIKENFIRYVKTAFGTKFNSVEDERYSLLNYDKVLFRKPWIEPLPDYVSSGKRIDELNLEDLGNSLNETEAKIFKDLVKCGLFSSDIKLHAHQAEMLKSALRGENCIITSGTGSGKTESFLLPLFAQLAKEFTSWSRPGPKPATVDTWWRPRTEGGLNASDIVDTRDFKLSNLCRQRHHETRPAGVRALILYPMNALVEDQMSRLRRALDSDDTRTWLATNTNGNKIYFGRYNGSSPVAGELRRRTDDGVKLNRIKVEELTNRLNIIETDSNRVQQYIDRDRIRPDKAKELKSFFQRLDGSEMRCRFDMQVTPPDILITNYSMLSIMLMRDIDAGIFNATKSWLAGEDLPPEQRKQEKQNRIFHLVIDELHLYRGTQGTEVAYLLKLVLNRLGLHPHHEQLRILASSASLEPGGPGSDSVKFLSDFFGIDHQIKPFKIIEGKNNPVSSVSGSNPKLPVEPFALIANQYDSCKGNVSNTVFKDSCQASASEIANRFNIPFTGTGIHSLLSVITHPNLELKERLYAPCQDYKAVCSIRTNGDDSESRYFSETIFEAAASEEILQDALRGLLISRALLDEPEFTEISSSIPEAKKLPRFRFHYFFRNIEGIWASVDPGDVDERFRDNDRTMGKLYSSSRINSETGRRVLELLYCDNCGTTMFGGSRLVTINGAGNYSFELLPISPNIEGIPEKTPAKLVEKRTFQEYAIFWPCGNQQYTRHDPEPGIPQNYWRQTTINGFEQGDFEANWVEASLHYLSGDIDPSHEKATKNPKEWIRGYYFTITPNNSSRDITLPDATGNISLTETHRALPCVCPSCGLNHQKRRNDSRKIKTTSIRGFRTGFAKTTQMFAKELMYQLPDNETERKLVVFSDSREDAAQIANGIERNHFTDLLREILVNELHTNLILKYRIVEALDNNDVQAKTKLRTEASDIYDAIEDLFDKSIYNGPNTAKLRDRETAVQSLNEYRSLLISVRELVHITNSLDLAPLIKHFIKLGINPGGNNVLLQEKLHDGRFVPWYDLINFQTKEWQQGIHDNFIVEIREGTFSSLASMFFGTLFYSFESSALGYVSINQELPAISIEAANLGITRNDLVQIINSSIRIFGDKYKHNKVDDADPFNINSYRDFPGQVKRYIRAVATRFAKQENDIGNSVYSILSSTRLLTGDTGIQVENLFIKVARPTDSLWISSRGSRPHLHYSAGICTHSITTLPVQAAMVCDDIWEENYLSYNAIKEKRPPIRLHCEELTGQTDDQFERQRHFRNIILPDEGEKQVKTIDLLSVTTTLEVGVDIGALQAVMLGNMPPQRFNYQQRVGRAGRRGQAYSVILTFCRGRSHDEFYFANPHKITGDAPPTPFLTMDQERIFKRLLAKELFRRAYKDQQIDISNDAKSSVHGEFGNIGDGQTNWLAYKTSIIQWINNNRNQIEDIVDCLITPALRPKQNEFINWICDTAGEGFIHRAQNVINNDEIATSDISEKLAEGGILPMFGMPTTVRNLYHGINRKLDPLAIDRPQSMAIYEFAPNAQKTKDKAIHQVIGFTSDFINRRVQGVPSVTNARTNNQLPFFLNRWFVRCRGCGFFETYSEARKTELENLNTFSACPVCQENSPEKYQGPVRLKSPRAYRTNLSLGKDSKDDSELLLSRPPIFAEKTVDPQNPDQFKPVSNTHLVISDKDVTWRVNTNSDKFFRGRLYNTNNKFPFNQTTGFWFNDQWLLSDLAANFNINGYSMYVQGQASHLEEEIALASNKKTEILRISPTIVPQELNLDMFSRDTDLPYVKAQSSCIRSAYYSAAFFFQRILADKLDVDPAEIEIADISMKILNDGSERRIAEIILTDELPNGSGFVRYLYDNFQTILNEALTPANQGDYLGKIHADTHFNKCADACYDCLKVYRNMNYHSLLDWRLGLSMIRILANPDYKCGTDGNFNQYIELRGWLDFARKLGENFTNSFGAFQLSEIVGLPVLINEKRKRDSSATKNVVMIIHPLWNLKHSGQDHWLDTAKAEIKAFVRQNNGSLSVVDSFNLHRRPGWCYDKLIQR